MWGDTIDEVKLQLGNTLKIDFDVESREYNSRWYTSVRALKIEVIDFKIPIMDNASEQATPDNDDDILPF